MEGETTAMGEYKATRVTQYRGKGREVVKGRRGGRGGWKLKLFNEVVIIIKFLETEAYIPLFSSFS